MFEKFMIKKGTPIISAILLSLIYFGCEKKVKIIRDYQELINENLITKGWVPVSIPKDFTNLVLKYDLDSNKGCGRYSFDKEPYTLETVIPTTNQEISGSDAPLEIIRKYCPENEKDFMKANLIRIEKFILYSNDRDKLSYFIIVE